MKDRKLVSMVEYVLNKEHFFTPLDQDRSAHILSKRMRKCIFYANFLNTPLELGMFVPCDEEGNVLEKPVECYDDTYKCNVLCDGMCVKSKHAIEYQEAEQKVLFEGKYYLSKDESLIKFVESKKMYTTDDLFHSGRQIIDLIKYDLTLTESAIKEYGL